MLVPILLFIVGLVLLIKGGDWFVDGATGLAHRFHVPEILIGATVVSIGTTLPEVMVSATSAVSGHGEIAYGNAIGSVICNTALIAALTIAIRPGGGPQKSADPGDILFHRRCVLRRHRLHQRCLHPPGGHRPAGHVRSVHGPYRAPELPGYRPSRRCGRGH